MMRKLNKIASESELTTINITHPQLGKIRFNLFDELIINEQVVNRELSEQPTAYAYLGILHKKLNRMVKSQEMEVEKIYSKVFLESKETLNPLTNRVHSQDTIKEMVKSNAKYRSAIKKLHDLEYDKDLIYVCLNSFEQRASMIQSISANNRKIS